jgi:Holliday junction resolvase-like predicted endonuclease
MPSGEFQIRMRGSAMTSSKSSRHSKIAGDFGESLVLYWLSKHGFECAKVDHTGIDLIAKNPHTGQLMGISVKSRTRDNGTETDAVYIPADDFEKVDVACEVFGCAPYFAIVVDASDLIRAFIIAKMDLLELFPVKKNSYWKMSADYLKKYSDHEGVMMFELKTNLGRWWQSTK